jgi:hypothetical protein
MPLTRTQIISQALTLMGKRPIMNLTNQSDIVTAADNSFDMLLQATLSEGFWRFATKVAEIQQNVNIPIGGYWFHAYNLPSDYLKMVHLWPHLHNFELYAGAPPILFTNFNNTGQPLFVEYVFLPDVSYLPPYFVKYFIFELAAFLALTNAQMPDYYSELDKKKGIELAIAQAADAQNRPQTPLQSAPVLARRYVSTFCSNG